MKLQNALLGVAFLLSSVNANDPVGYLVADDYNTTLLNTAPGGSSLYSIDVDTLGEGTGFLLDLHGDTRYDLGYDQGVLIGDKMYASINALLNYISGGNQILNEIMEEILLWQWDIALSHQTPSEYLEEIRGITDGSKFANPDANYNAGDIAAMGIVLANLPGSGSDIIYVLLNEMPFHKISKFNQKINNNNGDNKDNENTMKSFQLYLKNNLNLLKLSGCSNFGAWGSRTLNGEVFTGRNLDWTTDTGINNQKLITVYHPSDGYAHATIGFAGLVGAITGMSEKGITVHEANLESDLDTFYGFPWTLRLRNIMEQATSLEQASELWAAANNTCGFNHAIGSSSEDSGAPMFMALETDAGHTATFFDMDDRELSAENGDPRTEALYRTNHGYDPQTIAHYQWNNTGADTDSNLRYQLFPAIFDSFDMGTYDLDSALYTAAVLGPKGDDFYHCGGIGTYGGADNVISAAFAPQVNAGVMYASWETGSGDDWTPASCSTYVKFDLSQWW